jgi:hypothetical protein
MQIYVNHLREFKLRELCKKNNVPISRVVGEWIDGLLGEVGELYKVKDLSSEFHPQPKGGK